MSLGSANGASCDPAVANDLLDIGDAASGYSVVLNDQFQGGHNTRHCGQPQDNIHAVQLQMTQLSYVRNAMPCHAMPFDYLPQTARNVQPQLWQMIVTMLGFARERAKA